MSIIVKKGFKLILTHILALALSAFFLFIFGWIIGKWGFYPYSVICTVFYFSLFYSEGWNWGRLEGKKYNNIKENPLRALAASVIPSVLCVALAVLSAVKFSEYADIVKNALIKIWYFPFVAFFNNEQTISVKEILLSGAVIPVVVPIGYYVGTKNFSVLEKIAYRKNKKKEQEKKAQLSKTNK